MYDLQVGEVDEGVAARVTGREVMHLHLDSAELNGAVVAEGYLRRGLVLLAAVVGVAQFSLTTTVAPSLIISPMPPLWSA